MKIKYNSTAFPAKYGHKLIGENSLNFTLQQFLWAAITVGRRKPSHVLRNGIYSKYEISYRVMIIMANIAKERRTGHLLKSIAYTSLDPSEKGAVSYFIGLTLTKLLAEKLLSTPWLLHLDVYKNSFFLTSKHKLVFAKTKSRPDLLGLNTSKQWIVMESKGRSGKIDSEVLGKAKNQTKTLRTVGGTIPELKVAVVAHFKDELLTVDWTDPDESNVDSIDIPMDNDAFLREYYELVYNILAGNNNTNYQYQERQELPFVTYRLIDLDLTIGLDKRIFDSYTEGSLSQTVSNIFVSYQNLTNERQGEQAIYPITRFNDNQNIFIGNDGILVSLGNSWLEAIELINFAVTSHSWLSK